MRPRVGRLAGRGGAFLVSESCVTRCVRARAALRPFVVWRALPLNGRALGVPMLLSGCASGSRQRSVKAQVPAPPGPRNRQSERACSCSDHFGIPSVLQAASNEGAPAVVRHQRASCGCMRSEASVRVISLAPRRQQLESTGGLLGPQLIVGGQLKAGRIAGAVSRSSVSKASKRRND